MRISPAFPLGCLVAVSACLDPLDKYGVEENVTVSASSVGPTNPLADDQISSKNPVYDATRTVVQTFGQCTFTFNLSSSVIQLDVVDPNDSEKPFVGTLYPTYAQAATTVGATFPTVDAVGNAIKTFDDAFYGAVETAVEDGSNGSPIAKGTLYSAMASQLLTQSQVAGANPAIANAAASMGAAQILGGYTPDPSMQSAAQSLATTFQGDLVHATPTAFYDRTPTLSHVFTRDRFLMYGAPTADLSQTIAAAQLLPAGTSLRASYDAVNTLYAGISNPSRHFSLSALEDMLPADPFNNLGAVTSALSTANSSYGLADPCGVEVKWLPPADAPENELYRQYVCQVGGQPPADFLDALVTAVLNGTIDLTPKAGSGWYAQQLYALQVLLDVPNEPEGQHLMLTERYKEKLVQSFKTLYIQTRDTQAKQVELEEDTCSISAPITVHVTPQLVAEPLATYYLREARGYAFVENILDASLTTAFLDQAHGIGDGGVLRTPTLRDELHHYEKLLYGLHILTADSIGLEYGMAADEEVTYPIADCRTEATTWLASWQQDPDFAEDPRVAVPVAVDNTTTPPMVTYWVVVGAQVMPSTAAYYPETQYEPITVSGNCTIAGYDPLRSWLLVGESIEIERPASSPVLTRTVLRSLLNGVTSVADATTVLQSP